MDLARWTRRHGNGAANGRQRRKMPAKFRNPQNPDETGTGIGRSPK